MRSNFKNIFVIALLSISLSSCLDLRFTQAMPSQAAALSEFPEAIRGQFVSKHNLDTLCITAREVLQHRIVLGDDYVLKQSSKYLVLNSEKDGNWNIVLIKPRGTKSFKLYSFDIHNGKKRKALNAISPLREVYDSDGGVDYLLASPDDKAFAKMIRSKGAVCLDTFKRIDDRDCSSVK